MPVPEQAFFSILEASSILQQVRSERKQNGMCIGRNVNSLRAFNY